MLLDYLASEKLELLANLDSKEGAVTLRLFKLVFAAFPSIIELEPVMAPQVCNVIGLCVYVYGYARVCMHMFVYVFVCVCLCVCMYVCVCRVF